MSDESRFLGEAIELARANIGRGGRPFGAVLVRDGKVIATAVNEIHASNDPTSHAEMNAILSARQPLEGCTLYVVPFMPCSNCGAVIVQSGIKRVVTLENNNERWLESFEITRQIFGEAGIELVIRQPLG